MTAVLDWLHSMFYIAFGRNSFRMTISRSWRMLTYTT